MGFSDQEFTVFGASPDVISLGDSESSFNYEKRVEASLKECLQEYLEDDNMMNRLPTVIKTTLQEEYKANIDSANKIKAVYSVLFKGEEI